MEEFICGVEFLRGPTEFFARVSSEAGGVREYRGPNSGTVIDQVINDLQEEFESAPAA
jgi:molybdopterin converting factor small subunit